MILTSRGLGLREGGLNAEIAENVAEDAELLSGRLIFYIIYYEVKRTNDDKFL